MQLKRRCDCAVPCDHPWWYKFKHNGQEYRASTKTANKKLAERIATRVRNNVIGERAGLKMEPDAPQPLFSAARKEHLEWARGAYPASADKTAYVLVEFEAVLGDRRLDEYKGFDIERWRSARAALVKRSTVDREFNIVRAFFTRALVRHKLAVSPFVTVDPWKVDDNKRLVFDDDQLQTAFTYLRPDLALIGRVTIESLARLSEVLGIQRTDLGPSWIQIRRKGGKVDRVTVTQELLADLRKYCRLDGDYVFSQGGDQRPMTQTAASMTFTRWFRAIGLPSYSHHCFRHTGVTLMLENGVNPRTIQKLAGWTSMRMLERYGHPRDAEARRAVEGNAAHVKKVMAS